MNKLGKARNTKETRVWIRVRRAELQAMQTESHELITLVWIGQSWRTSLYLSREAFESFKQRSDKI